MKGYILTDPHELFADRLIHTYRRSGTVFAHGTAVAITLSGFLLTEIDPMPVLIWVAFLLVTTGYNCYLGIRLMSEQKRAMLGVDTRSLMIFAALAGLGWGAGAAFLPFVSSPLQLLLIFSLTAIAAASLPRMSALPMVHAAFMTGLFVPVLIGLAIVFGAQHWMMVIVLLVIWAGLTNEARKAHVDLVELYSVRQVLQAEVEQDKLTGIQNRRSFDNALEREWRHAQRLKVPISLIMMDVDFFKKFNDHYGHQAGDACLTQVAQALAKVSRRAGDLTARYGGEEFVALLFHTPRDDAFALADKLRKSVESLHIPHEKNEGGIVTISLGGATCVPGIQDKPETLLHAADAALYQAKSAGRNRVNWSTEVQTS